MQDLLPVLSIPNPNFTFEGISNDDNFTAFGFQVLPPDTDMDVGPNHIVQVVNTLLEVYTKAGTSLLGPLPINSLFTSLGGPCATTNDGDPIALYDPLADRWLVSQFSLPNFPNGPFFECIAISQTADPTGAYHLYAFQIPNNKLGDYPKLGVWPDGYYMSVNQFASGSLNFAGVGVAAFDRAQMLAGGVASQIYFDLAASEPLAFGFLPSDLDGPAPPAGTPNYFTLFTAGEFGDPQGDALRIFNFHADFVTPLNSTFTERTESHIPTAPFNPDMCGFARNCIPQPGTAQRVDAISDLLMFRLQYRNFGTHESLVTNHTVDANNADLAGVRYYELRRSLPGGAFAIVEQSTFAPDTNHRWMGSAALDKDGNLAVGYSVSSTATFPSIRYAGRLAADPSGLTQGEATLQVGAGSQTSTSARWGDYSMMAVDPSDDCTFWYTTEYFSVTSDRGWQTRIGSFKFPSCGLPPPTTTTTVPTTTTTTVPPPPPPPPPAVTCNGLPATIVGDKEANTIFGTPGNDVIHGRGGNDIIRGLGGRDVICGGAGDDRLFGNRGKDRLFGGGGNDVLKGGRENDRLFGQGGDDAMDGGPGSDDNCNGGSGTDMATRCEQLLGVP